MTASQFKIHCMYQDLNSLQLEVIDCRLTNVDPKPLLIRVGKMVDKITKALAEEYPQPKKGKE